MTDPGPGTLDEAVTPPRHLVPLLAAFASLVILTTDVYLPVLPDLARDLGTSDAAASATVSCVLVGIAIGQVVIGPLSDAIGRRAPLLVGAAAYAVMHVLSALAPSITVLLVVRVLAGFATAACIVVGRAIVVDLFPGAAMTRAFATLGAVTAIVPVAAPVAGGVLALVMGWRGMFLVLAALALVITVVGWRALPESLPPERRTPPHLGSVLRGLWALLCLRTFLAYAAATGAVAGILFGYIGASSFVLQRGFGLSPQQFGLVFAINSIGIFVASNLTRRLASRVAPRRLLATGQVLSLVGVGVLGAGVGGGEPRPGRRRAVPGRLQRGPDHAVGDGPGHGGRRGSRGIRRWCLRHRPVRCRGGRLTARRRPRITVVAGHRPRVLRRRRTRPARRAPPYRAADPPVEGDLMTTRPFPQDFLWGVASAGHQSEGDNTTSDTWFAEHVQPTVFREPSGRACNGYELWREDVDLAAGMGLNAYRFSVEWARVEPVEGSSTRPRSTTTRRSSTAASSTGWRRS